MASSTRDDFPAPIVSQIARRAGYRCSMCRVVTVGPSDESPSKASTIGVACHITAAAPGGPRYDPSLTPEQRRAIENAIWMCNSHSRLIDSDVFRYTVARLHEMKTQHEAFVKAEMEGAAQGPARDIAAWVSETLLAWPTTLAEGTWLPRSELDKIKDLLATPQSGALVLLGAPGSGKSALLARLGTMLREGGVHVAAIKADRIPKTVSTQDALAAWTGASEPLERVLRHHALMRHTVLLVDQLDALADLVDLETARLDVVLELLDSLRGVPDLHLVISCRSFEFRHDLRMRRLDAEAIELALPSWDEVDNVLKRRGLDATGWPDRLRELLLVPQQLKLFLEVAATSAPTFASYQGMLEELWRRRVKGDGSRIAMVDRLASQMATDEVLDAPLAILDDLPPRTLEELIAGGILRQDATMVAFAHQSLFDFARARAFAAGNVSLVDYVLQRQTGVFVRPILWSGLTYLRGARPAQYRTSFLELWQRGEIRLHVRVLLAEFLGQLEDPDANEAAWLSTRLDDVAVRRAALTAMHGSPRWFERISPMLPELMTREWRLDLAGILSGAASFSPSHVVDLLEAHWGELPATQQACIHVVRFLGAWDERAVAFIVRLLRTGAVEADGIFATVAENAPQLAPRVLATMIGLALDKVSAATEPSQPNGGFAYGRKYEDALGKNEDLIDLSALARDVPREYLEAVFPVFERFADALAVTRSAQLYRQADIGFAREGAARFVESLLAASETLARNEPASFMGFARCVSSSEVGPIHQVLATGFAALPIDRRQSAFEYLIADERRLRVGAGSDPDRTSASLLRSMAEHLSSDEVQRIEGMILRSLIYEPVADASASAKRARLSLNRAHRARLLRELPRASLSTESRMLIAEEEEDVVVSDASSTAPRGYKSGSIRSPMSTDQMVRAQDSHLLGLFALLTDETEWRHPRRDLEGGSIEASRAFGELAKRVPERVAALVDQLSPETQERPVAHALTGLAEISWNRDEWERVVLSCDQRGFRGEDFRWHVASAIGRRAQGEGGASDALCALLEGWLDELPARTDEDDEEDELSRKSGGDDPKRQQRHSLLFGMHGGGVLPRGSYPIIHALFCALMFRSPPSADRFLEIVERQLPKHAPANEWYWLAFDLRHVSHCSDRARAERFLRALFTQYPSVLGSEAGALLVAHSIWWVGREAVRDWITALRVSLSQVGRQASGELLVLASSLGVDLDLDARPDSGEASIDERVGIALAVAHEWYEPQFRTRATVILLRLLEDPSAIVRESALSVVNPRDELPVDEATRKLLDLVASKPDLIEGVPKTLFEQLHVLLPMEAERVATIITKFLDALDAGSRTDASWVMIGPDLMRAAVTLQRLSAFRERGMQIFERLLARGAYGVDDILFDLDGRPRRGRPRISSPRRFRPQRVPRRR